MTLAEANALFRCWPDAPPTHILVNAIVSGFGGKAPAAREARDSVAAQAEGATPAQLAELSAKAGRALPIIRGKDLGLPKAPPAFSADEMRRRNAERILTRHRAKNAKA